MTKHSKIYLPVLIGILLLASGCKEENYLAEESRSLMLYQRNQTNGNLLALAKAHARTIAENEKQKKHQPGLYADYAVCLAKLGNYEEANRWFNLEMTIFPASAKYVKGMKENYVTAYAADTLALPTSRKPDEKVLAAYMFNDADESLEPILPDVSDDFSDDPASIEVKVDQQPEMTEKEVAAYERSKHAKTEEQKALTAEERAKAKKQAAKEKEKAKKKAAKEKEKAKKQAQKEKEAAKKQAQKEKEIARKQAQKEKEEAKKQAIKEKEEARKQAQMEREEARAKAAEERATAREKQRAN